MEDMLKAIRIKNREQIDKITELMKKCNKLRQYEGECYQLKLDLKHYEEMKKELAMKNNQIEILQQELMGIKKNIMKVIEEIKIEINENHRSANIGKKGCIRRLYNILN